MTVVHAAVDDETLLRQAQDGFLGAFEELVRRHRLPVFRVALRMLGNRSDAEDAAQEAFVDAWRGLDRFRGEASVSSWLYRIVVNRCLQHTRRTRPTTELSEDERTPEPGPARTVEERLRAAAVTRAVSELPGDLRAPLVLHEFERLSYDEIGEVLGIPSSTVRGRLVRARRQLLDELRGWA